MKIPIEFQSYFPQPADVFFETFLNAGPINSGYRLVFENGFIFYYTAYNTLLASGPETPNFWRYLATHQPKHIPGNPFYGFQDRHGGGTTSYHCDWSWLILNAILHCGGKAKVTPTEKYPLRPLF